jgi:hypothetical protein
MLVSPAGYAAVQSQAEPKPRRNLMKTIVFALIAALLALSLVTPASAFDDKTFWAQQRLNGGGG